MFTINTDSQFSQSKFFFIYNSSPGNGGTFIDTGNPIPPFSIYLSLLQITIPGGGYKCVSTDDFMRRIYEVQSDAQPRIVKTNGTPEATPINELAYWVAKGCIRFQQAVNPVTQGGTLYPNGTALLPWDNNIIVPTVYGLAPGPSPFGVTGQTDSNFSSLTNDGYVPTTAQFNNNIAYDGESACYFTLFIE